VLQIKLYTPYLKQKQVHQACNDKTTFFTTVNAGRQAGKSLLGINQALKWSLSKNKRIVYWVSPTASQATKVYKNILNAIDTVPIIKSHKGSQGDTEIIFKNGSTIKFRSAQQEESLRGESVHYMVIDEAAYIKETTFQTILLPMLNVLGKKCLIISTPKGRNWFYSMWLNGKGTDIKYSSFKFTSADNPHANQDIINMAKSRMPKVLFDQEYMAEFVDSAAIFENIKELAILKPILGPVGSDKYFVGIDIGMKNDYTVVTVLNQKGEMVYVDRFTNVTSPVLKERVKKTLDLFKPVKTFLELNNQGGPIFDDLYPICPNLQGFNTTSSSKPEIINNLINAFSSSKLKVIDEEALKLELESFTVTYGLNGRAKFSAPSGFHDDYVMSLAIAYECLNKNLFTGSYVFM